MVWTSKVIYKKDINVGEIIYREQNDGEELIIKELQINSNDLLSRFISLLIPNYKTIIFELEHLNANDVNILRLKGFRFNDKEFLWIHKNL